MARKKQAKVPAGETFIVPELPEVGLYSDGSIYVRAPDVRVAYSIALDLHKRQCRRYVLTHEYR